MADVDPARLEEAVQAVGDDAIAVPTDAASWDSVRGARRARVRDVRRRSRALQQRRSHASGLTWEFTLEEWRWVLGVNLDGVFHGIKAFVPRMIEQGDARPRREHRVRQRSPAVSGRRRVRGVEVRRRRIVRDPRARPARARRSDRRLRPLPWPDRHRLPRRTAARSIQRARNRPRRTTTPASSGSRPPTSPRWWSPRSGRPLLVITHPAYHESIEQRCRGIVETDELVSGGLL